MSGADTLFLAGHRRARLQSCHGHRTHHQTSTLHFRTTQLIFSSPVNSNEILTAPDTTLCLAITQNQNNTYLSNSTAPVFSITWEYPFEPVNETSVENGTHPLIHAFPQASLSDTALPITLEDLGELNLNFSWTMGIGNDNAPATSTRRLFAQEVNASVALDMYIDASQVKAADAGKAGFEMIIFFASYGLQTPVGFGNGTAVTTQTVGGVVL